MHYHGTPITPRTKLLELAGRCFCVRFGEHRDVEVCHEIGQSVMLDNGAFSAWTQGREPDWPGFADWARPWLEYRTTWAVAPDVIDGDEEANDALLTWLYAHATDVWRRCAPVWHMHESIERLQRLCGAYSRVCVGSSGEYRVPGTDRWHRRIEEAFNAVCGNGPATTWLHMLRAMNEAAGGPYPFASADSTNLARNHAGTNGGRPPMDIAKRATLIDAKQCPARWRRTHEQGMLRLDGASDESTPWGRFAA
jgi:hypothetical protein